jgi:inorganic pyrophosphatase
MTEQHDDAGDWYEVIVEIPQGTRNKYEIDHDSGAIWLDRHLFNATVYPAEYGFFPDTLAEDGDPLDALVLLGEPTFPGCWIRARPVAVFHMSDEKGPDEKVILVPLKDPQWSGIEDITDVNPNLLNEIEHFFTVYKDLEPGATEVRGWGDRSEALEIIRACRARATDG